MPWFRMIAWIPRGSLRRRRLFTRDCLCHVWSILTCEEFLLDWRGSRCDARQGPQKDVSSSLIRSIHYRCAVVLISEMEQFTSSTCISCFFVVNVFSLVFVFHGRISAPMYSPIIHHWQLKLSLIVFAKWNTERMGLAFDLTFSQFVTA